MSQTQPKIHNAATAQDNIPAGASAQQAHIYVEMFRAIDALGRKLEKVEAVRDTLSRRLDEIESAAARDEKTGKLYLPAVIEPAVQPFKPDAKKQYLSIALSGASCIAAFFALWLVAMQAPAPRLTPQQLALLNTLSVEPAAGAASAPVLPAAPATQSAWKPVVIPSPATDDAAAEDITTLTTGAGEEQVPAAGESSLTAADFETPADIAALEAAEADADAAIDRHEAVDVTADATETAPVADADVADTQDAAAVAGKPATAAVEKTASYDSGMAADKNLPAVFAALERRAFAGEAAAQHDLATRYAAGDRVTRDYTRAAYWFRRAADGGVANAHYNLGVMAQQGLGMSKSLGGAVQHYHNAARLGHAEAVYNLGIAYVEGIGTTRDVARGVGYFKRAANAGVPQAAYNLGVLYENGVTGRRDTASALEWYQVAANEGHAAAADALTRLRRSTGGLTLRQQ